MDFCLQVDNFMVELTLSKEEGDAHMGFLMFNDISGLAITIGVLIIVGFILVLLEDSGTIKF